MSQLGDALCPTVLGGKSQEASSPRIRSAFPHIPDGSDLYVIGDVHGCADQLEELLDRLPLTEQSQLVFVGDYIDRGPDSRRVVDMLLELRDRYQVYPLIGNHEQSLLEFIDSPTSALAVRYILNGGSATLQSYNDVDGSYQMPSEHVDFFRSLAMGYQTAEHFFVHAGLPNVSIADLDPAVHKNDMLWLRRRFFFSQFKWEKCIVHGHTPVDEVEILPERINVDTGCVYDGKLSAIHLPTQQIYQVAKHLISGHIFLKEQPGSRRRAVRFDGRIDVEVLCPREVVSFETINYNDFGILMQPTIDRPDPVFEKNEEVEGELAPDADTKFSFKGRIVRIERRAHTCRYAIQFDAPPTAIA